MRRLFPKRNPANTSEYLIFFGKGASFLGTMLMGISTQLFHTSKAGVVMIALMFVLGFVTFYFQGREEAVSAGTESHPKLVKNKQ